MSPLLWIPYVIETYWLAILGFCLLLGAWDHYTGGPEW